MRMRAPRVEHRKPTLRTASLLVILVLLTTTCNCEHVRLSQRARRLQDAVVRSVEVPASERLALIRLWNGTAHGNLPDYMSQDVCSWPWVSCCLPLPPDERPSRQGLGYFLMKHEDEEDGTWAVDGCPQVGTVAGLQMTGLGLSGTLPVKELQALTALQSLELTNNPGLNGGGVDLMELLHSLRVLNIQNTSLSCSSGSTTAAASSTEPDLRPLVHPESCGASTGRIVHQVKPFITAGGSIMYCAVITTAFIKSNSTAGDPITSVLHADPAFFQYRLCTCADMSSTASSSASGASTAARLQMLAISDSPSVHVLPDGKLHVTCHAQEAGQMSHPMAQLGLILGVTAGILLVVGIVAVYVGARVLAPARKRCKDSNGVIPPGTRPDLFAETVALVATDVEGSTELWEWQPELMNEALLLHDTLMRALIAACGGYEVTTEGDAFLVAWHTPVDAVRWCLMLQQGLLKLAWPEGLLQHHLCAPRLVSCGSSPSSADSVSHEGQVTLFKGLSVRMGVASGVPSSVVPHPTTGRMQYSGLMLRLATAVADMALGGQVLLEPCTFRMLHGALDQLHADQTQIDRITDHINTMVATQVLRSASSKPAAPIKSSLQLLAVPGPKSNNGRMSGVHMRSSFQTTQPLHCQGSGDIKGPKSEMVTKRAKTSQLTAKDEPRHRSGPLPITTSIQSQPSPDQDTGTLVSEALSQALTSFETVRGRVGEIAVLGSASDCWANDGDAVGGQEQLVGRTSSVTALFARNLQETQATFVRTTPQSVAQRFKQLADSQANAVVDLTASNRCAWDPMRPGKASLKAPFDVSNESLHPPTSCSSASYGIKSAAQPQHIWSTYNRLLPAAVQRLQPWNKDRASPSIAALPPIISLSPPGSRTTQHSVVAQPIWMDSLPSTPTHLTDNRNSAATLITSLQAEPCQSEADRTAPNLRPSTTLGSECVELNKASFQPQGMLASVQSPCSPSSYDSGQAFGEEITVSLSGLKKAPSQGFLPSRPSCLGVVMHSVGSQDADHSSRLPSDYAAASDGYSTGAEVQPAPRRGEATLEAPDGHVQNGMIVGPSARFSLAHMLTQLSPDDSIESNLLPSTVREQQGSHASLEFDVRSSAHAPPLARIKGKMVSFAERHTDITGSIGNLTVSAELLTTQEQSTPCDTAAITVGTTLSSQTADLSWGTFFGRHWSKVKASVRASPGFGSQKNSDMMATRSGGIMKTMPVISTTHLEGQPLRRSVSKLLDAATESASARWSILGSRQLGSQAEPSVRRSHLARLSQFIQSKEFILNSRSGMSTSHSVQRVVILDMGVHFMKSWGPTSTPPQDVVHGLQLIQVLPVALSPRASYLDHVQSTGSLAPSFFDAPGAKQAFVPRPVGRPAEFPPVVMMFISPEGADRVAHCAGQAVYDQALATFCAVVRSVLQEFQLYECQEFQGVLMIAAASPSPAIKAALVLQHRLMAADWPPELLSLTMAQEVKDPDSGQLLFRGLRAKTGLFRDVPLSIVPHTTTGRADYWGSFVNRAARYMAGASGGQVLADAKLADLVMDEWAEEAAPQQQGRGSSLEQPTQLASHNSDKLLALHAASMRPVKAIDLKAGQSQPAYCPIDSTLDTMFQHSEAGDVQQGTEAKREMTVVLTSYPAALSKDMTATCEMICVEMGKAPPAPARASQQLSSTSDSLVARWQSMSSIPSSSLQVSSGNKEPAQLPQDALAMYQVNVVDLGSYEFKGLSSPQQLVGFELVQLAARSKELEARGTGGGKAKRVRQGAGTLATLPVWLPFYHADGGDRGSGGGGGGGGDDDVQA